MSIIVFFVYWTIPTLAKMRCYMNFDLTKDNKIRVFYT